MKIALYPPLFAGVTLSLLGHPLTPVEKHEAFFLLGMTNEYLGHPIGRPSTFYGNQSDASRVYARHAERLRKTARLDRLGQVWSSVDSLYRDVKKGTPSDGQVGEASWSMFLGNSEYAEDFLSGAVIAFWDEENNRFHLPNMPVKAHVLVDLLARLGAQEVRLVVHPDMIPAGYEVSVSDCAIFDTIVAIALTEKHSK